MLDRFLLGHCSAIACMTRYNNRELRVEMIARSCLARSSLARSLLAQLTGDLHDKVAVKEGSEQRRLGFLIPIELSFFILIRLIVFHGKRTRFRNIVVVVVVVALVAIG